MRRFVVFLLLSVALMIGGVHSEEHSTLLIGDLIKKESQYKGKKITLKLKFKHVNRIFNTISFYDRKNIDIRFDISSHSSMNVHKHEMLNLHEGLDYYVTFIFNGAGNLGLADGELIRFMPVIMTKLPEGK